MGGMMNKIKYIVAGLFLASVALAASYSRFSDVIVSGTEVVGSVSAPSSTAVLEAVSTTKGFLPPRMSTTQRDAIAGPNTGLIIYNNSTASIDNYNGSNWRTLVRHSPNQYGVLVSGSDGTASVIAPDASTTKVLTSGGSSANPTWQDPATAPSSPYETSNVGLSVSVGSNALTVALKQSDGSTNCSSGAAACKIGFRSSTATTGGYNQRSVTAALSATVSQYTQLGNDIASFAYTNYVYAIDSDGAGTIKIGISNAPLNDKILQSAVKESATVTISNATPAVITETGHNRITGEPVIFKTSGSLPTGLTAGTVYYVSSPASNTYSVSSVPNGSEIATSSAGSGSHTAHSDGLRLYSDGYYSSMPIRLIGSFIISQATPGTWASSPTSVSVGGNANDPNPWQKFTLNCVNISCESSTALWRKVNDTLEIKGTFTTGSVAASTFLLYPPNGLRGAIESNTAHSVGILVPNAINTTNEQLFTLMMAGNDYSLWLGDIGANQGNTASNSNKLANGQFTSFWASFPVLNW